MRDLDIRQALRIYLRELQGPLSSTLIVEEMPICLGRSRVDLVTVNGRLHGFEIKSQLDTLSRLHGYRKVGQVLALGPVAFSILTGIGCLASLAMARGLRRSAMSVISDGASAGESRGHVEQDEIVLIDRDPRGRGV